MIYKDQQSLKRSAKQSPQKRNPILRVTKRFIALSLYPLPVCLKFIDAIGITVKHISFIIGGGVSCISTVSIVSQSPFIDYYLFLYLQTIQQKYKELSEIQRIISQFSIGPSASFIIKEISKEINHRDISFNRFAFFISRAILINISSSFNNRQ